MIKKSTKDKDDYFFGEHFETKTFRDQWRVIFPFPDDETSKKLTYCLRKGKEFFHKQMKNDDQFGLRYPASSLTGLTLLSNKRASVIPLLRGMNNDVTLKQCYTWKNNMMGEMAVETAYDGHIINFYNPCYAIDVDSFKFDKIQTVSLAGLCFNIKKMKPQTFVIKEGKTYEYFLNKFLKENPDKTKEDFQPVVMNLDPEIFRSYCPKNTTSYVEIATQIEDIDYFDFLGSKIARIKVNLEHTQDGEHLYCYFYASEHVLGTYTPKVGDGIVTVVWMTGYFN